MPEAETASLKPEWAQRATYTYTPAQLEQYFSRIALPHRIRRALLAHKAAIDNGTAAAAAACEAYGVCDGVEEQQQQQQQQQRLALLTALQRYHLAAVPFENLYIHYTPAHAVSIDPEALFDKVVGRGGGFGGYCMENSGLFGVVLRSLGYDVYPVSGRVSNEMSPAPTSPRWNGLPRFDPWDHMVNIVTLGSTRYHVDVGFGSSGPHQPVPLIDDHTFFNYGRQHSRLRRCPDIITARRQQQQQQQQQQLWMYEICNGVGENEDPAAAVAAGHAVWTPAYCFTELEFTPDDFEMINFFTSQHRSSWFTHHVVASRLLLDDDDGERGPKSDSEKEEETEKEDTQPISTNKNPDTTTTTPIPIPILIPRVTGDITLLNTAVRRRTGPAACAETLATFSSETQRVAALERWFGIRLRANERAAIGGWVTQIRG